MASSSSISAAEQSFILWTFLGSPDTFSNSQARQVIEQIVPSDERNVAKQLKRLLVQHGQKVKHVHCLEIAAKIGGRRGWYDGFKKPVFEYFLGAVTEHEPTGLPTLDGTSSQFSKIGKLLADSIFHYTQKQNSPFVITVIRSKTELTFLLQSNITGDSFASIKLIDEESRSEWTSGVPILIERIRRQVEEAPLSALGFLDGYASATRPDFNESSALALGLYRNKIKLCTGRELAIFSAIEKDLGSSFYQATPLDNAVLLAKANYSLCFENSSNELVMEQRMKKLLQDETDELLRRYRRLKQRAVWRLDLPFDASAKPAQHSDFIGLNDLLETDPVEDKNTISLFAKSVQLREPVWLQAILDAVVELKIIICGPLSDSVLSPVRGHCQHLLQSRFIPKSKLPDTAFDQSISSFSATNFLKGIQTAHCSASLAISSPSGRAYIFISKLDCE